MAYGVFLSEGKKILRISLGKTTESFDKIEAKGEERYGQIDGSGGG